MSEHQKERKVFSLLQVTRSIQKTLSERYGSAFWVKAELNKLNHYPKSGHCYPELVEKKDGKIVSQIRSVLWENDYLRIDQAFRKTVHEPLKDGIKILFLARIKFDPHYGLSLHILDIDPEFTLGDLEREKQETLQRLKTEGIFELNKNLKLAQLPQRIAVISVETSKGYADFLSVLEEARQRWKYEFFHLLFPSVLQGDRAASQMLAQLGNIRKVIDHFDAVVIVRGGGGDIGLSCYNNYALCREIALFPIPVITGIGHATNETAAEMTAYKNAITPSKLAEVFIQKFHDFSVPLEEFRRSIVEKSKLILLDQKANLQTEIRHFRSATRFVLSENRNYLKEVSKNLDWNFQLHFKKEKEKINRSSEELNTSIDLYFKTNQEDLNEFAKEILTNTKLRLSHQRQQISFLNKNLEQNVYRFSENRKNELENLKKNIALLDPQNVLKRGYSISTVEGKLLMENTDLKIGSKMKTVFYQGEIISEVKERK